MDNVGQRGFFCKQGCEVVLLIVSNAKENPQDIPCMFKHSLKSCHIDR